jgi:hypothetical protein
VVDGIIGRGLPMVSAQTVWHLISSKRNTGPADKIHRPGAGFKSSLFLPDFYEQPLTAPQFMHL